MQNDENFYIVLLFPNLDCRRRYCKMRMRDQTAETLRMSDAGNGQNRSYLLSRPCVVFMQYLFFLYKNFVFSLQNERIPLLVFSALPFLFMYFLSNSFAVADDILKNESFQIAYKKEDPCSTGSIGCRPSVFIHDKSGTKDSGLVKKYDHLWKNGVTSKAIVITNDYEPLNVNCSSLEVKAEGLSHYIIFLNSLSIPETEFIFFCNNFGSHEFSFDASYAPFLSDSDLKSVDSKDEMPDLLFSSKGSIKGVITNTLTTYLYVFLALITLSVSAITFGNIISAPIYEDINSSMMIRMRQMNVSNVAYFFASVSFTILLAMLHGILLIIAKEVFSVKEKDVYNMIGKSFYTSYFLQIFVFGLAIQSLIFATGSLILKKVVTYFYIPGIVATLYLFLNSIISPEITVLESSTWYFEMLSSIYPFFAEVSYKMQNIMGIEHSVYYSIFFSNNFIIASFLLMLFLTVQYISLMIRNKDNLLRTLFFALKVEDFDENKIVSIKQVSKSFGSKLALREVSLELNRGVVTALLGHNGSGKSTLINVLLGTYKVSSGRAYVCGLPVELKITRDFVGVCPQSDFNYGWLSARTNMILFCLLRGYSFLKAFSESNRLLSLVGLRTKKIGSCNVSKFSGGMRRRLTIASALIGNPKIIIFDEPTTGLDPVNRRKVWDIINDVKKTATVIITSHSNLEMETLSDDVVVMKEGSVVLSDNILTLRQKSPLFDINVNVNNPAAFEHEITQKYVHCIPNWLKTKENSYRISVVRTDMCNVIFLLESAIVTSWMSHSSMKELLPPQRGTATIADDIFSPNMNNSNINARKPTVCTGFKKIYVQVKAGIIMNFRVIKRKWKSNIFACLLIVLFVLIYTVIPSSKDLIGTKFSQAFDSMFSKKCIRNDLYQNIPALEQIISDESEWVGILGPIHTGNPGDSSASENDDVITFRRKEDPIKNYKLTRNLTITKKDQVVKSVNLKAAFGEDAEVIVPKYYYTSLSQFTNFRLDENVCIVSPTFDVNKILTPFLMATKSGLLSVIMWLLFSVFCEFFMRVSTEKSRFYNLQGYSWFVENYAIAQFCIFFSLGPITVLQTVAIFQKSGNAINTVSVITAAVANTISLSALLCEILKLFKVKKAGILITMILPFALAGYELFLAFHSSQRTLFAFIVYPGYASLYAFLEATSKKNNPNAIVLILILTVQTGFYFLAAFTIFQSRLNAHAIFEKISYLKSALFNRCRSKDQSEAETEQFVDESVHLEKEILRSSSDRSSLLVQLSDVSKSYGPQQVIFDNVSFRIKKSEGFGLLGGNGAGKSHLVKIITSQMKPTSGTVEPVNLSNVGLIPQDSIFEDELTVDQNMFFYAGIKAISPDEQVSRIDDVLEIVGLENSRSKVVSTLSGGMKRRVAIAIAILGAPDLLVADEPTTALDVHHQENIWKMFNILKRDFGTTVLMVSHTTEEIAAVCDKIVVLQGTIKYIGSHSQLHKAYGGGWRISLLCETVDMPRARSWIANIAPQAHESSAFDIDPNLVNRFKMEFVLENMQVENLAEILYKLSSEHQNNGVKAWGFERMTLEDALIGVLTADGKPKTRNNNEDFSKSAKGGF